MSYGQVMPQAREQTGTPASDNVLVAGVAGKRIAVAYVFISSVVAGEVEFDSGGANLRFVLYVGDNGGATATAPEGQFLFQTAAGESLTWTSDIANDHFVCVLYQEVG